MDRRKREIFNPKEEETFEALQESASRCGARVHSKIRVADTLDIKNSGLTNKEYSYAFKSHFDFVADQQGKGEARLSILFVQSRLGSRGHS
jgi:hypothetical protein